MTLCVYSMWVLDVGTLCVLYVGTRCGYSVCTVCTLFVYSMWVLYVLYMLYVCTYTRCACTDQYRCTMNICGQQSFTGAHLQDVYREREREREREKWGGDTHISGPCNTLQHSATHCTTLQRWGDARRGSLSLEVILSQSVCSILQRVAACCSVLQCVATCCTVMQRKSRRSVEVGLTTIDCVCKRVL